MAQTGADWTKPIITDLYTAWPSLIQSRDADLAVALDPTYITSNYPGAALPTGAVRFRSNGTGPNLWERWSGAAWAALDGGAGYNISILGGAAKWTTARTLTLGTDASGSVNIDGSGNVTLNATLATVNANTGTVGGNNSIPSLTLDQKGRVTAASAVTPSGTWAINISGSAGSLAGGLAWASITGKPTTVAGYAITDLLAYLNIAKTWTAQQTFSGNQASVMATATGGLGAFWVYGDGTNAAFMAFHRPGAYAGYLGLDTDNKLKWGGWSLGSVAYELLHAGNYTSYSPSLTGSGASGTWGINVTGSSGTSKYPVGSGQTWNYSGQGGQPSWLWGTNDGNTMYPWNPSNFSVASAVNVTNALGIGQSSSGDIKASRAWNTTYTNSTSKPIFVSIYAYNTATSDGVTGYIAGVAAAQGLTVYGSSGATVSMVVAPGQQYSFSRGNGNTSLQAWYEYK